MSPVSILFVCLGNICRSPMAEGVFRQLLEQNSCTSLYKVDSDGTLGYHQGELPDSRMMSHASKRGYELSHRSRKFKRSDFEDFDWIIAMDDHNYDDLKSCATTVEELAKIHCMVEFSKKLTPTHIPDPYYGGTQGFDHVIDLLEDACQGFFEHIVAIKQ